MISEEVDKFIRQYFDPYMLRRKVMSQIREAEIIIRSMGYELTPDVILEALKIVVDITEYQSKWSIDLYPFQIRKTLDSGVLKRHIIEHYRIEEIKKKLREKSLK